jgi:hypothetical protein
VQRRAQVEAKECEVGEKGRRGGKFQFQHVRGLVLSSSLFLLRRFSAIECLSGMACSILVLESNETENSSVNSKNLRRLTSDWSLHKRLPLTSRWSSNSQRILDENGRQQRRNERQSDEQDPSLPRPEPRYRFHLLQSLVEIVLDVLLYVVVGLFLALEELPGEGTVVFDGSWIGEAI